jgi:hypothetical protein
MDGQELQNVVDVVAFVSKNSWKNMQPTLMHEGWCNNLSI